MDSPRPDTGRCTEGFEASHITVTSKEGKLIRPDQLLKVTRQEEAPKAITVSTD